MTNTRNRLIEAAAALLDRGGPAAVTLRAVGSAAGVSHNAPYGHFADKDELLAVIAARELDRLTNDAPLREQMTRFVDWALRSPERFRLTFGRWTRDHPILADAADRAHTHFVNLVRSEQATGDLPEGDAERLAALILATAHGAAAMSLAGHLSAEKGHADASEIVHDLLSLLTPCG